MSRRQYCHDSSWRWNPFQDNSVCREKPQYQQNVTDTCSYPIPVSITANSSASILDENGQNTLQSCSIKAQRHPLPARPPTEVCLGDGSRSSNQSDQLQADDSQKLTPDEHILQNLGSSGPVQTLEHSDTAYIDPKILINGPSPNVESVATAGNYPDPDLTGNRSSPKSPSLNASFISVWPTSSRQCETEDTMMLDQPAFRAATSSPSWNKTTHNGATQSHKRTGFHKDPSFSSVRSQFLAMSVGGRLQFLSWLFEGTLQQCVSMPTGFNLAATNEGDHWLNESVINDFPVRNQHIEPVDVQDISWDEGGSEAMQIHQIEYEVEKILKHMQSARGSVSYLVKWKGYDDTEATWEPFDSVQDTAALEYYERQLGVAAKATHKSTAFFGSSSCNGTKTKCSLNPVKSTKARRNSPTKRRRYSPDEDRHLVKLKHEQKLPWSEVFRQYNEKYPGRKESSVQVHWSTKVKPHLQCQ